MEELVARLSTSLAGEALEHLIAAASGHSDRGDGGTLVYLFDTPEGSLLFQDTSGHWGAVLATLTPDVAILAAAGLSEIEVRRRIRLVALSTGDELRPVGHPLDPGSIYDSNRPMLGALLTRPWIETLSTQHVNDQMDTLAETLRKFSLQADVIVTTGGAAGSDTDHTARAIVAAGGQASSLRLALRPGKPVVFGKIDRTLVLGLPGNPVAAMVNFLLFGRALVLACAGLTVERPRGQAALTAGPISHSPGRTELVPARIVGFAKDGRPLIEKLGRGGSARLRPLVLADGLAEIPRDIGDVGLGAPVSFHAFHAAFAP